MSINSSKKILANIYIIVRFNNLKPRVTRRSNSSCFHKFQQVVSYCNINFTLMACTSTNNVNLEWIDFARFYAVIFSNQVLENHLDLTHILKSWDAYIRVKFNMPLIGLNKIPPTYWRLRLGGKGLP